MPSSATPLRLASVNVNGVRAAFRRGMGEWLVARDVDILAMQEVRATTDDLQALLSDEWLIVHDESSAKGRAGVAIASRRDAHGHRVELGDTTFDTAGRWLEADFDVDGRRLTVVSAYVHTGDAGSERQQQKERFLKAIGERMPRLAEHAELAVVVGDLNVGHRTLDIKNWKGNLKKAGFLPEERAYFDGWLGAEGTLDYNTGATGWVDVGRRAAGDIPGPYTWWSWRGKAFDNDAGWRIDYQLATTALAATVVDYTVDRASAYDERWSDHAPVVVDYAI